MESYSVLTRSLEHHWITPSISEGSTSLLTIAAEEVSLTAVSLWLQSFKKVSFNQFYIFLNWLPWQFTTLCIATVFWYSFNFLFIVILVTSWPYIEWRLYDPQIFNPQSVANSLEITNFYVGTNSNNMEPDPNHTLLTVSHHSEITRELHNAHD
jgi:hypothetical protein